MLSRTAESLYWMGRYMERAENTARLLDVSERVSLQHGGAEGDPTVWTEALAILGTPAAVRERFGETANPEAVVRFVVLDPENPSSILAGVRSARENGRALRSVISNEMWETLNATWLALRDIDAEGLRQRGLRELCDWVKERSHLFRGVAYGTTLHDDAFHFLRLGTFLERADNTARLLDTKTAALGTETEGDSSEDAYYDWGAVLRAVSAFRSYHRVYRDVITPTRVAELLLLRREMPRSLRFCTAEAVSLLDQLGRGRDLECQRLAGELHARLRFARIDRVWASGLHGFLVETIDDLAALGRQIATDFLMTT